MPSYKIKDRRPTSKIYIINHFCYILYVLRMKQHATHTIWGASLNYIVCFMRKRDELRGKGVHSNHIWKSIFGWKFLIFKAFFLEQGMFWRVLDEKLVKGKTFTWWMCICVAPRPEICYMTKDRVYVRKRKKKQQNLHKYLCSVCYLFMQKNR